MSELGAVWGFISIIVAIAAVGLSIYFSRNRYVNYRSDAMLAEMSRRLDELTLEVVELKLALSHHRIGIATLSAQVIRLGEHPEWSTEQASARAAEEGEPLVRIYQLITEHFQISEIDELAALSHVPPESFSGDDRPARALSLVQYAARHGHLEELVAACRKKRPQVKWPLISL